MRVQRHLGAGVGLESIDGRLPDGERVEKQRRAPFAAEDWQAPRLPGARTTTGGSVGLSVGRGDGAPAAAPATVPDRSFGSR